MGRIIGEFNVAFSLALAAAAHYRVVTIRIAGDVQIDPVIEAKVCYIGRAWPAGSFDNDQRLCESHPRFSKTALNFGRFERNRSNHYFARMHPFGFAALIRFISGSALKSGDGNHPELLAQQGHHFVMN